MKAIKNIIFDLGGVIMNLDVPKTIRALHKIGIEKIVNNTGHNYHHSFFMISKQGQLLKNNFQNPYNNYLKKKISFSEIIEAWNEMILDIPADRTNFLKDLKKEYNLFLLG